MITFATGQQSQTISISIIDDIFAETTESFSCRLSTPTAETLLDVDTAMIEIVDNDGKIRMLAGSCVCDDISEQVLHCRSNTEYIITGQFMNHFCTLIDYTRLIQKL